MTTDQLEQMETLCSKLEVYLYHIGVGGDDEDDLDPLDRVHLRHPNHLSDQYVSTNNGLNSPDKIVHHH